MKIQLIIPFLTILSTSLYASSITDEVKYCKFKLPKYIYLNSLISGENSLKNNFPSLTNCSEKKAHEVFETIRGINGKVPIAYIEKILTNKNVKLIPADNFIVIDTFSNLLRKKLSKEYNIKVSEIKHSIKPDALFLDTPLSISINESEMTGTIKGKSSFYPSQKKQDFEYNYSAPKVTWVTKETLYPYSPIGLSNNVLSKKLINLWKDEKGQYLDESVDLQSYQIAKIIHKNKPLKKSDIKPKTVIQMGKITPVILEANGLIIKTNGVSQRSGKLGETIEVKLKNNKVVRGTILLGTDYYVKI